MDESKLSLCDRVLKIAGTMNGLDETVYVTGCKNKIIVKGDNSEDRLYNFFEIDVKKKDINFSKAPKSSIMEKECIDLTNWLKEKGYTISGLDYFIKKPTYKQRSDGLIEFSLY